MIVLMETDDDKGAPTVESLSLEHARFVQSRSDGAGAANLSAEDAETSAAMLELIARVADPAEGGYIEWHRERHLRLAALKRVAEALVKEHRRLAKLPALHAKG